MNKDEPQNTVTANEPQAKRFWDQVEIGALDDCWEWNGTRATNSNGGAYGRFLFRVSKTKTEAGAHRYSYRLHFGDIPKGKMVLHKCDNPPCVNPNHLELGDNRKNIQDAVDRGLTKPMGGEHNGQSKIGPPQVHQIRRLKKEGYTIKVLAVLFGLGPSQISRIINRQKMGVVAMKDNPTVTLNVEGVDGVVEILEAFRHILEPLEGLDPELIGWILEDLEQSNDPIRWAVRNVVHRALEYMNR